MPADWQAVCKWSAETILTVELQVDSAAFDHHDSRAPKARSAREKLIREHYLSPSTEAGMSGVFYDPATPTHANGRLYSLFVSLYLRVLSRRVNAWSVVINPDPTPLEVPTAPITIIMHPQVRATGMPSPCHQESG